MIDAREFNSKKELEKAMLKEYRAQIESILRPKYDSIKSDMLWIEQCMGFEMFNAVYTQNRDILYRNADRIEECAKRIAVSASVIKSTCRLIQEEKKNESVNEDRNA